MQRNILVVLILLALSFGCSDSNESANKEIQQSDGEKINLMVESIQPIFASLRTKANEREEPKAVTYEVVTDRSPGLACRKICAISILVWRLSGVS